MDPSSSTPLGFPPPGAVDLAQLYNMASQATMSAGGPLNANNNVQNAMMLQNPWASTMLWNLMLQQAQPTYMSAMPFMAPFLAQLAQMSPSPPSNPELSTFPGSMSTHVSSSSANSSISVSKTDEEILVQALVSATLSNQNYKRALNSIHSVNNVPYESWKNHYLVHKFRIDEAVSARLQQSAEGTTQARTESPEVQILDTPPSTSGRSTTSTTLVQRSPGPDGSPCVSKTKKTWDSDDDTSSPPSRCPTPPNESRNAYTEEDNKYLADFIQWKLRVDPKATKYKICKELGRRAPHHTRGSWGRHWDSYDGPHKRIFAKAKARSRKRSREAEHIPTRRDSGWSKRQKMDSSPRPSESGDSDADSVIYDDDDVYDSENGDDDDDDDDFGSDSTSVASEVSVTTQSHDSPRRFPDIDFDVPKETDEPSMGQEGYSFTEADIRLFARHVAANPGLSQVAFSCSFHELYPTRTKNSWKSMFYNYKEDLAFLVEKYSETTTLSDDSGDQDESILTKEQPYPIPSSSITTSERDEEIFVNEDEESRSPTPVINDDPEEA